jgi:hypothetical protein
MADRICPILSRPVVGDADTGLYFAEVACLRERCAAWYQYSSNVEGYCKLIWGSG